MTKLKRSISQEHYVKTGESKLINYKLELNSKLLTSIVAWINWVSIAIENKNSNVLQHYHYAESVDIRSFSGPYFSPFGLNTERHSKCGKTRARWTLNILNPILSRSSTNQKAVRNFSKNSRGNTCAGVNFVIKLCFCQICETFWDSFLPNTFRKLLVF